MFSQKPSNPAALASDGYVDLGRVFRDLAEDERLDPSMLAQLDRSELHGAFGWATLLKSERVIILAEAGSGKTRELEAQKKRLELDGKAAFFLPIEALQNETLEGFLAMQPGEAERLMAWLGDESRPAWFFLDAVDELKLKSGKLDFALGKMSKALGAAGGRAHIVLTCRPTDWRPNQDMQTVVSRLPVSQDLEEDQETGDDAFLESILERRSRRLKTTNTHKLRTVVLEPLTDKQIKRFAEAKGVVDGEVLLREIRRRDAWSFARRPLDLSGLVRTWISRKGLGTRLEQHETDVSFSLMDNPERPDKGVISGDMAREGAERLALALALTKTWTIKVPERVLEERTDSGILDSEKVLANWTEEQRQALLRRPVFDVATYGRVRFHHRGIAEYLAAQRLNKLKNVGVPKRRLMRLLFLDRYGEKVAIPSMRPIAAWLSLWDDDVRKELLEREPETMVSHGDAESLPISARIELVRRYVGRYGAGGWRGLDLSVDDLQRLASPELADEIKARWAEPHSNNEVRVFLLKLIWLSGIAECADLALGAAMDIGLPHYTRTIALHALSECERTDLLRRAADDMIANPGNWPGQVMHSVPQDLYPDVITTSELVHFLKMFPESMNSVGGFSWTLANRVDELAPGSEGAVSLRRALADLIWQARKPTATWYSPQSEFGRLAHALAKLCLRELERGGSIDPSLVHDTAIARRFHDEHVVGRKENEALGNFFSPGSPIRSVAHTAELELMSVLAPTEDPREQIYFAHRHGLVPELGPSDWDWLLRHFSNATDQKRRAQLFYALLAILQADMQGARFGSLRGAVTDVPEFVKALDLLNAPPPPPNPAHLKLEKQQKAATKEREKQNRQSAANWLKWRKQVESDPADVFAPAKREGNLWTMVQWLQSRETENTKSRQSSWREVRDMFGNVVGDTFEAAARAYWRDQAPEVWSTKAVEERNQSTVRPRLALMGLSIEAASSPKWAEALRPSEAEIAAAWATTELNGFPEWFDSLAFAQPEGVREALERELEAEFTDIATIQYPQTLSAIQHSLAPATQQVVASLLKRKLLIWPPDSSSEAEVGPSLQNLERVLVVLAATMPADPEVAAYCEQRFKATPSGPLAVAWLRGIFENNFVQGVKTLRNGLDAVDQAERRQHGLLWLTGTFGEHGLGQLPIGVRGDADFLLELTTLAYECIRREDDVHHEGVYTPDLRDDAESARNRILSALVDLPGQESYDALIRLSAEPLFRHMSDRIKKLARERATVDSEPQALSTAEFQAWEQPYGHPPRNPSELFDVVCDRLDDLDYDMRHHSFNVRDQLQALTEESELQPHIARYFYDHARGLFAVTRESEVADNKKPDVVLGTTQAGSATIEIKVGDRWSVTELEAAVKDQLVGQYLRHPNCQVGHLLVTYAGRKRFKHPITKEHIEFSTVISHLQKVAAEIQNQQGGKIRLGVVGLDLRPPLDGAPVPAKRKTTPSRRTSNRSSLPKGTKSSPART